jgi:hypothetical protein
MRAMLLAVSFFLLADVSSVSPAPRWSRAIGIRPERVRCLGANSEAQAAKNFLSGLSPMRARQDTHAVGVLRIEFTPDSDPLTTGNGTFGNLPFYMPDPDSVRAEQGYVVRDPSIDSRSRFYFSKHLQWASEYFETVSGGLFGFAAMDTALDVSPLIRLQRELGYYGDNEEFAANVMRFVKDAVASADTLTAFDFSRFDALLIFHAGAGEESDFGPPPLYEGDSPRDLHSLYVPFEAIRDYLGDGDPSYRGIPTVDAAGETTFVRNAIILPETLIQDSLYNPSAVFLDILGIVVHEYGHHLGLPDLYDPDHPTRPAVGNFCLMGTGAYNASARLPAEPMGWLKYYLGWVDAVEVEEDTVRAELFASEIPGAGTRLLKVPLSSSEYYLLENRIRDRDFDGVFRFDDTDGDNWPDLLADDYRLADGSYTEFDFALPGIITFPDDPLVGSGVLVWHIDNEVIRANFDPELTKNCINCNISRQGVDLEEADGTQHLDALYPLSIDPGYGSPFDSYGGAVESLKEFGNLHTLFGPSTNPSTITNLGIESHLSISGFFSLTVDPSASLVDSLVGIDVEFGQELEGFPVLLREEGALDFETDPLVFGENAMAVADMDGIGSLEIAAVTRQGDLFLIDARGHSFPEGSLVTAPYASLASEVHLAPSLGDLEGDGTREVALVTEGGSLHVLTTAGPSGGEVELPGFPVDLGGNNPAGPLFFDVNGDGGDDLVAACVTAEGLVVSAFSRWGILLEGWPVVLTGAPAGFLALSPYTHTSAGSDSADIIVAREDGTVHKITHRGRIAWQVAVEGEIAVPPVLADFDRDGDRNGDNIAETFGDLEIAVATLDGLLYMISSEGDHLPGGPQDTGGKIRSPLAASDLDMDGYVEIVALAEETWSLHVFRLNDAHNSLVHKSAFPKSIPVSAPEGTKNYFSAPVTADLDGVLAGTRTMEEILFGTMDNRLLAFDLSSSPAPVMRFPLGGDCGASPVLVDLDGNDSLDVLSTDDRGSLYAWDTGMALALARVSWEQLGSDPGRTYANTDSLFLAHPGEAPVMSEDNLYVYPNPFIPRDHSTATLHFEADARFRETVAVIYDVSGRKVKEIDLFDDSVKEPGIFDRPIEIRDLPSGVYIVSMEVHMLEGGTRALLKEFAILR